MKNRDHEIRWKKVKDEMVDVEIGFGPALSKMLVQAPESLLQYLSLYKFAAKMIGKDKRVLNLHCGEGLGAWLLAVECGRCRGVDWKKDNIHAADRSFRDPRISFEDGNDFFDFNDNWDAVVAFLTLEDRHQDRIGSIESLLKQSVGALADNGIAIVGLPNIRHDGESGHSFDLLKRLGSHYFHHAFFFGAVNEMVTLSCHPLSDYAILIGCIGEKQ